MITANYILREYFNRDVYWDKDTPIKLWKSSGECRPPPIPSNGVPNQMITADHILRENFNRDVRWDAEAPINPFMPSLHNNIKPPHTDLYQLDVHNAKSTPMAWQKLTFGTSSCLERVRLWKSSGDCRPLPILSNSVPNQMRLITADHILRENFNRDVLWDEKAPINPFMPRPHNNIKPT